MIARRKQRAAGRFSRRHHTRDKIMSKTTSVTPEMRISRSCSSSSTSSSLRLDSQEPVSPPSNHKQLSYYERNTLIQLWLRHERAIALRADTRHVSVRGGPCVAHGCARLGRGYLFTREACGCVSTTPLRLTRPECSTHSPCHRHKASTGSGSASTPRGGHRVD